MTDLSLITGAGTGIGRGLALALASRGRTVLIVGRRAGPLAEVAGRADGRIETCQADIATVEGRAAVVAAVAGRRLRHLVHNAAVLEPIGPLSELSLQAWRQAQAVNVEAPLFLTQALLPLLSGGRILNVSSGAAHHPYAGWGSYCVSKAALQMLTAMMQLEFAEHRIVAAALRPGVVDTPMQALIRGQSEQDFPPVQRFRQLHAHGQLSDPEQVGGFMAWLLEDTDPELFAREPWSLPQALEQGYGPEVSRR